MSDPHTPGPWQYDGKFTVTIPTVGGALPFRVLPQDARLIVAAPDLLKAAHAAYHALKSYQYGNAAPALAEECAEVIVAAIAKAEGRS